MSLPTRNDIFTKPSAFIIHHSSFTLSPSYPFFQYRPIPLGDTLQARIRYTDAQGDKHEQKFICRTF